MAPVMGHSASAYREMLNRLEACGAGKQHQSSNESSPKFRPLIQRRTQGEAFPISRMASTETRAAQQLSGAASG